MPESATNVASATVLVVCGAPVDTRYCHGCGGCRYTIPLTGLTPHGTHDLGVIEACPECDVASDVVERWRRDHP
ncbi:hypothetical protein [Nocardia farcinica]|uniref:hypothetical protein n=1 Tax=Nocardia farcinica TaxID=37329 RepID=UPI00189301B4|nr:hypothetical protein [Nocardia farcinica]MBF6254416.1 hypothetical protein [Nocardia farcinica]